MSAKQEIREIYYDIFPSPVGMILVAATQKGLSYILLGDNDIDLVEELHHKFPKALLEHNEALVFEYKRETLVLAEGHPIVVSASLDIEGTDLQKEVWEHIRRIPRGETKSYQEIAQEIGKPSASRAVANACGANPVPLIVPCHRVVGSNGGLGGYGAGIERKMWLLAQEQIAFF